MARINTYKNKCFIVVDEIDENDEFEIKKIVDPRIPGDALEIEFTKMYDSPASGKNLFKIMVEISELFGTQEMDSDQVFQRGCETCDYGSKYGFELQVYGITKNYPDFYAPKKKGKK